MYNMKSILLLGMPGAYEWLFIIFAIILPLVAIIDILRSDFKDSVTKLIWVLVVLFFPFLGPIIYFVVGRNQRITSDQS